MGVDEQGGGCSHLSRQNKENWTAENGLEDLEWGATIKGPPLTDPPVSEMPTSKVQ